MPVGTYGSASTIWVTWNTTAITNTTAASTIANVWNVWVDATGAPGAVIVNTVSGGIRAPTPEETARREREATERAQRAAAARERARALLVELLDDAQRTEYEKDGHFHVTTRDGERVYRLRPGSPPTRIKGEDGHRWSYCIHPVESFPAEDTAAALKLMLESDEDAFLRIANAAQVSVAA